MSGAVVLDTHAWLWWLSESERLSADAAAAIDRAARVFIPAISVWEVATLVSRGRLILDRPLDVWLAQAFAHPRAVCADLTWRITARGGQLGASGFHGDPADRLIVATALELGLPLISKDAQIHLWDGIDPVW